MLELGEQSGLLHYQTGQLAAQLDINELYLFGTLVQHTLKGALENGFDKKNIFHFTKEQITAAVADTVRPGTWILVKGSRGMAMETVVKGLKDNINDHTLMRL
jgi:UDP-N-acetylmuramyl pentapeptide synthase